MNQERLFKLFRRLLIANFCAFIIGIFALGGGALNGHFARGHYYLCYHPDGPCHETSHAIFSYSWWHATSVMATILPTAVISVCIRFANWLQKISN